jgi:general secretion pathway protein B
MVLIALNLAVIVIWLSRTHTVSDVPAPSLDDRPMIRSAPPTGRATDEPPSEMIRAPSDEVVSNDPLVREPDARTPRPPNTTTASARIDAPLLGELPLSFRQTLPQFRLDVHVYADDRARRFVMLNLERLSEGDLSADGLEVVEIQADGVVLYWEGQLFFMPR